MPPFGYSDYTFLRFLLVSQRGSVRNLKSLEEQTGRRNRNQQEDNGESYGVAEWGGTLEETAAPLKSDE